MKDVDPGFVMAVVGIIIIIVSGVLFLSTEASMDDENTSLNQTNEENDVNTAQFTIYVQPTQEINETTVNESTVN